MSVQILIGDVRQKLAMLPNESVHCVVTSPPYYGLRDYGMHGQIGLEESPQAFIATLVDVFREVRRVLRADGTAWVNMGDSYAGSWGAQSRPQGVTGEMASRSVISARQINAHPRFEGKTGTVGREWGLKPKDKMLIPHRLAIALCDDGWYVRDDIVWAKPNPMPESVTDRCTKAHEYIFLLSKSERYFFDQPAIMEPLAESSLARLDQPNLEQQSGSDRVPGKTNGRMKAVRSAAGGGRNKRSVWSVATQPFSGAHFATFPPDLISPCILAGCPQGGTVLDPFFGAGTTGLVADRLHRNAIGIELNPAYAEIAHRRIHGDAPLFAEVI